MSTHSENERIPRGEVETWDASVEPEYDEIVASDLLESAAPNKLDDEAVTFLEKTDSLVEETQASSNLDKQTAESILDAGGFGARIESIKGRIVSLTARTKEQLGRLFSQGDELTEERHSDQQGKTRIEEGESLPRVQERRAHVSELLGMDIDQLRKEKNNLEEGLRNWFDKKKQIPLAASGDWANHYSRIVDKLEATGKLDDVFQGILDKITTKTTLLKDYDDLGITPALKVGDLRQVEGSKVVFRKSSALRPGDQGLGGKFHIASGGITILDGDAKFSKRDVLERLISNGTFGSDEDRLAHELTHKTQFPETVVKRLFASYKIELMETQAHRQQSFVPESKIDLLQHLSHSKYNGQIDKLIYSVTAVDQLRALGFTPKEVGTLISNSGAWDKKHAVYVGVDNKIRGEMEGLGIDEADLEHLVHVDKLNRQVQQLRVKQIAREVLSVQHLRMAQHDREKRHQ